MFCNLGEVIKVCLLLEEEGVESTDKDKDKASRRCKAILKRVDAGTWEWYQHVYHYIEDRAPHLIKLMKDKKQCHQFDALISKMGKVMRQVWLDDASHLKKVIGLYAMLYPGKKGLEPPLGSNESHSRMGFNHPELMRLLCPVKHLTLFLDNPTEMWKKLQDGHVTAISTNWPAFLYCGDIPGEAFNPI
ncbi:hypothetical protein EDD16DRAFT_1708410 [Pisolithus croceorrhizus]|nr:hypothetical protein EV401DRAFT_2083894 [Pisolithus croceorrhizus]KAI6116541.1 hypothetical protein EDD16DRAFT_1708410 [Pisolithus croceorrhizus]KAI6169896.1 hypothetical protein EDD17DRAFT_1785716 [Pisolithus thermaeus]